MKRFNSGNRCQLKANSPCSQEIRCAQPVVPRAAAFAWASATIARCWLRARGEEMAVTTDLSIAGRHFRLDWHQPEAVGHRALARGLSDLAAMGARPVAAFLSLGLPRELTIAAPAWPRARPILGAALSRRLARPGRDPQDSAGRRRSGRIAYRRGRHCSGRRGSRGAGRCFAPAREPATCSTSPAL